MDDAAARQVLAALGVDLADPADEFELQQAEGAGASGRVFRASRLSDPSESVALKVIPIPPLVPDAAAPSSAVAAVAREIAFLRACNHPNVVAFHGAYYKSGALWLAMEHCAGGSAAAVRGRRSLSEREVAVILRGALLGLAYLHGRRKLHRDIKGANILLTASGRVKLADFGVSASLASDSVAENETPPNAAYQRGTFVGTPYWMSPEMIQDGAYDHKADIWSLGITAIELADCEPPLFREHPMRALLQIPRNPPPTVRDPSSWSSEFVDFLSFVLRKNPKERPTATECLSHAFLKKVEGEDSVLDPNVVGEALESNSTQHLGNAVVKSIAKAEAARGMSNLTEEESRVDGEIADAIMRIDAVGGSNSIQIEGDEDQIAENTCRIADASLSSLSSRASSARNDELLELSVDECEDSGNELQPTRANSPVRAQCRPLRSSNENAHSSSSITDLSVELRAPLEGCSGEFGRSAEWTGAASVTNPLAEIDASTSNTRVSALLASISSPTSSFSGSFCASGSLIASDSISNICQQQAQPCSDPPAAALLRRSSFTGNLVASASFRDLLGNSRASIGIPANTTSDVSALSLLPLSKQRSKWCDLLPRQFGIPLNDQQSDAAGDLSEIPLLLHLLRRELLTRDALQSTRWIYRASPDSREFERARSAIDHGNFDPSTVSDSNVFASLLKLWLRELPAPLLSPVGASPIQKLARLSSSISGGEGQGSTRLPLASVNEQVELSLANITGRRRAVVEWLLDHWLEVLENGSSNRMTAHALAVVMAPSVYMCAVNFNGSQAGNEAEATIDDVIGLLRVLIYWRRACRDTGFVAITDRLEVIRLGQREGLHLDHNERETTSAAVWPLNDGKHNAPATIDAVKDGISPEHVPIESSLRDCVSRAVGLSDGKGSLNQLDAVSNELEHERFVAFQRAVADALASFAKSSEERGFADRFRQLLQQKPAVSSSKRGGDDDWDQLLQDLPRPLVRIERWLRASMDFDSFRQMTRSERAIHGKRQKLQNILVTKAAQTGLPVERSYTTRILHRDWGAASRLRPLDMLMRKHTSQKSGLSLASGAQRLLSMRFGPEKLSSDHTHELVKLGKEEPAVGIVLLAAMEH